MVNINIEKVLEDKLDVVDYLERIILDVKDGFSNGEGWEITGESEKYGLDEP